MNLFSTSNDEDAGAPDTKNRKYFPLLMLAAVVVVAVALAVTSKGASGERADIFSQGGGEPSIAGEGAQLERDMTSLHIKVVVPTPQPGSYEYPTADMAPPGASHPEIAQGSSAEPEVFTLWAFVFNFPDRCSDSACDFDDIGETPARGGIHQVDGRIGDEASLELMGNVRLGQLPATGWTLENPLGAEVHVAIAPHGKLLQGEDGWAQLNVSVGNPTLWWTASFHPETEQVP